MYVYALRGLIVHLLVAGTAAASGLPSHPTVHGRVLDADGGPLADGVVELLPVPDPHAEALALRGGRFRPEQVAETVSEEDGSFRLAAPETGIWRLRATAPGRVPMSTPPLALHDDHPLDPVRLPHDAGTEVEVRDPSGRPVAGAFVRALSPQELAAARKGAPWRPERRQGRTDETGRLRLARTAGETLDVWAIAPGFWQGEAEAGDRPARVRLRAAPERRLRLRRGDGSPARRVIVAAGEVAWPVAVTDGTGSASFAAPGDRSIRLRLELPEGWSVPVALPPADRDERDPVEIELRPTGGLSGRVVDAESREPIAGAVVWPPAVPGRAAVTDGRGRFAWSGMPSGEPFLRAAAPDHLDTEMRVAIAPSQTATAVLALRPAAATSGRVVDPEGVPMPDATVTVTGAAEDDPRVEAAAPRSTETSGDGAFRIAGLDPERDYALVFERKGHAPARESLFAGRSADWTGLTVVLAPGGLVAGRVVDPEERPVEGAEVLLSARSGGPDTAGSGRAETGADGRFEIVDLPAGTFTLAVRAAGFAPWIESVELTPHVLTLDLGALALEPEAVVEGRVEEPGGEPVAGAAVHTAERSLSALEPAAATTGADGRFRLRGLAPGERVTLVAERDGFAPALSGELRATAATPVVLVLRRAATLEGSVVTSGGDPVTGAQIWAILERRFETGSGGDPSWRRIGPVVTGADGRFELEGVPPGTVRVGAVARGWPRREVAGIEVPAGSTVAGIELVLEEGATVEGRVLSAEGEPVAGAEVFAVRAPDRVRGASKGVRSDGEGRYELLGVASGPARIAARHPRHGTVIRGVTLETGSRRLDLRFEAGAAVSGRVIDGSGAGVESAEVALDAADPAAPAIRDRTGPGGRYRLEPVPEGRYRLSAAKPGYVRAELPQPLEVGGAERIGAPELELLGGGSIEGRLLGLDSRETAAVEVVARGPATGAGREGEVLGDGHYRVAHLAPGEYVVAASIPRSGRQAQGRVALEEGAAVAHLDLDFEGDLRLTGRVLYRGSGLEGATLTLAGIDRPARSTALADAAGAFEFTGVVPGAYDLEVADSLRGLRSSRTVVMDDHRTVEIELDAGSVAGRVVDAAGGDGLAEVVLRFHPPGATAPQTARPRREVTTDSSGGFFADGLTGGRYRIEALKFGYRTATLQIEVEPGRELTGLRLELTRAPQATP